MKIWILFTLLQCPLLTTEHPNQKTVTTNHEITDIIHDPAVNQANVLKDFQKLLKTDIEKRIKLEKNMLHQALNDEPINLDLDIGVKYPDKIDDICQKAVVQHEYFRNNCESLRAEVYGGPIFDPRRKGSYYIRRASMRSTLNPTLMKPAEIIRRYYSTDTNPKIMRAETEVLYCYVDCTLQIPNHFHVIYIMGIIKKEEIVNNMYEVYLLYFPRRHTFFKNTPTGFVVDTVLIPSYRNNPPPRKRCYEDAMAYESHHPFKLFKNR